MIDSKFLQVLSDCGYLARDLDTLYDKKKNGSQEQYVIDKGLVNIDKIIEHQENRLAKLLISIREHK